MSSLYILVALLVAAYLVAGLFTMGCESRWKVSVFCDAVSFKNKPETTYKNRLYQRMNDWTRYKKIILGISFLLWWLWISYYVVTSACLVIVRVFYFFYNGFHFYPPNEQEGTIMDAE